MCSYRCRGVVFYLLKCLLVCQPEDTPATVRHNVYLLSWTPGAVQSDNPSLYFCFWRVTVSPHNPVLSYPVSRKVLKKKTKKTRNTKLAAEYSQLEANLTMHNNFRNAPAYLFLIELGEEQNKQIFPAHFSGLDYRKHRLLKIPAAGSESCYFLLRLEN